MIAVSRQIARKRKRGRTGGDVSLSLFLFNECRSPRTIATVRYGGSQTGARGGGESPTGSPRLSLQREKPKGDWGTRVATRQENRQPKGVEVPSRVGSRCATVWLTVVTPEMCRRCVTNFFPPDETQGGGGQEVSYDGTAICCNGGGPLVLLEESVFSALDRCTSKPDA